MSVDRNEVPRTLCEAKKREVLSCAYSVYSVLK